MSYDDYTTAPSSGSFARSSSIDYSNQYEYASQTCSPGFSSLGIKEPGYEYPRDGQRSLRPVEPFPQPAPQTDEVRPAVNSSNLITNDTRNRSLDNDPYGYDTQPYSREHLVRTNVSGYDVGDVSNEESAPSQSAFAERERSNSRMSGDAGHESVDPMDYVGISLVGRRFKMVNPDAYYVEKDDDSTGYQAPS